MMAIQRALFNQSDVTKILKACKDAGYGPPQIVIEPQRITVSPMVEAAKSVDPNPWDAP